MKKLMITAFISMLLVLLPLAATADDDGKQTKAKTTTTTNTQWGPYFVDANGDGICDNYRDHDGDGVPNYSDPDWTRQPRNGKGYKNGRGRGRNGGGRGWRANRRCDRTGRGYRANTNTTTTVNKK